MSKNRVTTVYCMSALRNVHLLSETQMTMQQNWYHSPHLTVSLGLLTGSGPSASSLHFISLTLSLGETVIYHRHGKHSCGACVGLIFFGPRTALSLDAFCLFPQAVPPSSPWGGVCRCGGLPALPGSFAVPHRLVARRRRCSSGGPTPPRSQLTSRSSPCRLSPAQPPQFSPWVWPPESALQHAAPVCIGHLRQGRSGPWLSIFPSANWLLRFPLRPSPALSRQWGDFQVAEAFFSHSSLRGAQILSHSLSLSLSLFPSFALPSHVDFLAMSEVWGPLPHSADVLGEALHLDMFCMYLCEEVSSRSYSSASLITPSPLSSFYRWRN